MKLKFVTFIVVLATILACIGTFLPGFFWGYGFIYCLIVCGGFSAIVASKLAKRRSRKMRGVVFASAKSGEPRADRHP